MESKKHIPFQKDQLTKIIDILGFPTKERWEGMSFMPDYPKLSDLPPHTLSATQNKLKNVFLQPSHNSNMARSDSGYNLLSSLLFYDPDKRISAESALMHKYFQEQPKPGVNSFVYPTTKKNYFNYPERKMQDPKKIPANQQI